MKPVTKMKINNSSCQRYLSSWSAENGRGLVGPRLKSTISSWKDMKIEFAFKTVHSNQAKRKSLDSLRRPLSGSGFQLTCVLDETPHISPPSSPDRNDIVLSAKRQKTCTSHKKGSSTKENEGNSETSENSQTPTISCPDSPIKFNTGPKKGTPQRITHLSLPNKKPVRSRKIVSRNTKRELFQDITVAVSPNKVHHSGHDFNLDTGFTISPSESPDKNALNNRLTSSELFGFSALHHSPQTVSPIWSLQKRIETPSKSKPETPNKSRAQNPENALGISVQDVDIVELASPVKKENKGSSWIGGITWQPKTPAKTPRNVSLPDSSKKRKYHVSGGLAHRLKILELREQSAISLQRHVSSSSCKGQSVMQLQVLAVDFSNPALPLASTKDVETTEDVLLVFQKNQVERIKAGSEIKMTKPCQVIRSKDHPLVFCAPEEIEVLDPPGSSESCTRSPHVIFQWQCSCRTGSNFDSNSCPACV